MSEEQAPDQLSVDQILAAFAVFDGEYKRAAVDAALARREEIIPRLVEVLDAVLANPEKIANDEDSFAHMYALMLLGHFREPAAHRAIVALASLPGELPHRLFGDTITEDLAVILLRTCGGSFEAVKGLARDRAANQWCRGAAADAIAYGVADGLIAREEALSFLGGLLEEEADEDDADGFCASLTNSLCDLCPEEAMGTIEAAFAKNRIDLWAIGPDEVREAASRGKEQCLLGLKEELQDRSLDDMHAGMSWWACFRETTDLPAVGRRPRLPDPESRDSPETTRQKAQKAKKAKRKMAQASRKKNRK